MRSERWTLRHLWVRALPSGAAASKDAWLRALDDPESQVRGRAAAQLLKGFPADAAVLKRVLAIDSFQAWESLHAALAELAAPELIEPLVQLLDSPRPEVRKASLATLKAIRAQLEEKKEWQAIVETMKARQKE